MRARGTARLVAAVTSAAAVAAVTAAGLVAPPPAAADAGVCNPDGTIEDPVDFTWTDRGDHWFGVLEYGAATFDIDGRTLTTRAYRQENGCFSIPGPTLRMTPGQTYVVRFRNLLDYEAPSSVHNDFKDPNVTNIHTHGLHISGEGAGDDVTRMFAGGEGGDYVYDIPSDHMGGTYWYHAHHHGSTYLQVSTGGLGLIVIDDSNDGIPAYVAAMEERQVLIAHLDTAAAGTGGDQLVTGTLPAGWTVNGAVDGTITMPPDTWQHWRVLLADADARMKTVSIDGACEAKLLARDGVWRTIAPKDLPTNEVALTGASRADLAVRCAGPAQLQVDGRAVATVAVAGAQGSTTASPGADASWSAVRPHYLRPLGDATNVHTESISMGARTVNGTKFDITTPTFTLHAADDEVQEWTIRGATNHPFHLHIYHFAPTRDCGDFEAGEYYDTIAANCTVRFDLSPTTAYDGMTIMHCHVLAHEDQGAMTWMDVVGGVGEPTYPAGDWGYSLWFTFTEPPGTPPSAPSDLTASATSSTSVDLAWTDNASDETGFEVERSLDGVSFALVGTTGADVTAFTDSGLTAASSYWYRVRATNGAGSSAWSDVVTVTTPPDTGGGTLEVSSVVVGTVNLGKGVKAGEAVVTILDGNGDPVVNASVTGDFRGTFDEPNHSRTTGGDGTATFRTDGSAKGGVSVTFCVTAVTANGYDPWAGPEVCTSA